MRYLLPHAVTESAEQFPHMDAVRCAGKSLTYRELEQKSNKLAQALVERGIGRGERIGIYMNKCLESAVAIYGIMKAGGAYVPLDPFSPAGRIKYVIRDCAVRRLVTNNAQLNRLKQLLADGAAPESLIGIAPTPELPVECISWEDIFNREAGSVNLRLTELDLAYILYTSGSTGVPKGIMHTHRSALSFAQWAAGTYSLTHRDRLANHSPLHFDLSTFDFFAGAIAGATTVIIPEAITKFPANLSDLIEKEKISIWYSVPFALVQLIQRGGLESRDLSTLRWILFAGEVFPTKHLRSLMERLPAVRFSNLYGPTETNVCTYYHVLQSPRDIPDPLPIGLPCANVEDLVVGPEDRPVPSGEVGELLIRGGVVMKGYWGQPEKTANSFYSRSVSNCIEDHFYRTGDLVQQGPDGNYLYIGRKDRQIKTRGYRVELDEIEMALLAHELVQEAATYPVPDGQASNLIEAAVIPREGAEFTEDQLIRHISSRVPSYAIPVKIHIVGDFPRTSTGKIDRRELQIRATDGNDSKNDDR